MAAGSRRSSSSPRRRPSPSPRGTVELAALVEPFAVALHPIHRSAFEPGDSVAVLGAGPIGLALAQTGRAAGTGELIVSEPQAARRERAGECGADALAEPTRADPVEFVRDETGGGADVAFEVAGVGATLEQAIRCTRRGGDGAVVGLFESPVALQPNELVTRERTVTGTAAYHGGPRSTQEFGTTIRNFANGSLSPELLVTSGIELSEIVEAGFEGLLPDWSDEVKVLVRRRDARG